MAKDKKRYQDSMKNGSKKSFLKDTTSYANMPGYSSTMDWSAGAGYLPEGYNDTMYGIDEQMAKDMDGAKKQFKPKSW